MRRSGERLFSKSDIFSVVQNQKAALEKQIDLEDADYLLKVSEGDYLDFLVGKFRFDVPVLHEDQIYMEEPKETKVDVTGRFDYGPSFGGERLLVPGTTVTFIVPFTGDRDFFFVRPSTFTHGPPSVELAQKELRFSLTRTDNGGAAIKSEFEGAVKYIKTALQFLREQAEQFNKDIPNLAKMPIYKRKQRLLSAKGMVETLGYQIRRRDGADRTYPVPVERKRIAVKPSVASGTFKQEPALPDNTYEEIIKMLKSMAKVMELSPHAFENMGEENLRFQFLVNLNTQFEGKATGETFNYEGKTDILIRDEGRNIFIAECKYWAGEKVFLGTIDQLLSYLSWRDTKTAILIFNRNLNFGDVLKTIEEAVPKHKHFKKYLGKLDESTFRYLFGHPEDSNRELIVTVLAFNVPTKSK